MRITNWIFSVACCLIAFGASAQQQEVFTIKDDKVIKQDKKAEKKTPPAKAATKPAPAQKKIVSAARAKPAPATKPSPVKSPASTSTPPAPQVAIAAKPSVTQADSSGSPVFQYAYMAEGKAISTQASRRVGNYFKVQFASVKDPAQAAHFHEKASAFGRIDTEYLFDNKLTRLLIGDYLQEALAKKAVQELKSLGFKEAFVVAYQDGVRVKSYSIQ